MTQILCMSLCYIPVVLNLFGVLDSPNLKLCGPLTPLTSILAKKYIFSFCSRFCFLFSREPESVWAVSETNSPFSHFPMLLMLCCRVVLLSPFSSPLNDGSCHLLSVCVSVCILISRAVCWICQWVFNNTFLQTFNNKSLIKTKWCVST